MSVDIDKLRSRAEINRANAQKSTGPKTEAGKKRSSLNALRHGLTGQVVVLPTEDLAEYERFVNEMHTDSKPVGALEKQLVQSVADDTGASTDPEQWRAICSSWACTTTPIRSNPKTARSRCPRHCQRARRTNAPAAAALQYRRRWLRFSLEEVEQYAGRQYRGSQAFGLRERTPKAA